MYSRVRLGARNKVRRRRGELRMEVCQCLETERQGVRDLRERWERVSSRSSVW